MVKKYFCFFQTADTGNRTPNSGVKGSGANHYPRAPALDPNNLVNKKMSHLVWVLLDSVMYRDAELNNANSSHVKCKRVPLEKGVKLEYIRKVIFIVENNEVHWL